VNRRAHIIVSGHVQGVCYRMNACMEARRYGVSGWIRNRRDGTVELEAEGSQDSVEEMIRWCRRGPALAVVREVHVAEAPTRNDGKPFRIVD